jgi:hypothetical protein
MHYHECQTSQNKKEYYIRPHMLLSSSYDNMVKHEISKCLSTGIFFVHYSQEQKKKLALRALHFL